MFNCVLFFSLSHSLYFQEKRQWCSKCIPENCYGESRGDARCMNNDGSGKFFKIKEILVKSRVAKLAVR